MVSKILKAHGFNNFGFTNLEPTSFQYYEEWLRNNFHGEMSYLERHAPIKANPKLHLPAAQFAIVVTKSYVPHPHKKDIPLPIAAYARGEDYHHWMLGDLNEVITELQKTYPDESFVTFVDSSPVLERDFALRAGLGWIGKNGCLIDQKRGSFEFIGGILTSLALEPNLNVATDHCGTCTRCMEACPTEAIVGPKQIDATKCVSYLTIESKGLPPVSLAGKIDSYFGCDICQTVCPWNRKVIATQNVFSKDDQISELRFILNASNRAITQHFKGTPLTRASAFGHRRNALLLIANQKIAELKSDVEKFKNHETLGELSRWVLAQMGPESHPLTKESPEPPQPESSEPLEVGSSPCSRSHQDLTSTRSQDQ